MKQSFALPSDVCDLSPRISEPLFIQGGLLSADCKLFFFVFFHHHKVHVDTNSHLLDHYNTLKKIPGMYISDSESTLLAFLHTEKPRC